MDFITRGIETRAFEYGDAIKKQKQNKERRNGPNHRKVEETFHFNKNTLYPTYPSPPAVVARKSEEEHLRSTISFSDGHGMCRPSWRYSGGMI